MISSFRLTQVVKRIGGGLALLTLATLSATAQTSVYEQVNVAGSFNGFETLNPNMVRVADNLWQADLVITNSSFFFKFATPNFAQDWGLNSQPHRTLPLAMTGIPGSGDIQVTNALHSTTSGVPYVLYRFLFNDATREFAVFLVNNQASTNLLYNGGFQQASGANSLRAYYWDLNNPNLHGAMAGTAERRDWNLGNGDTNNTGWVGLMKGLWAGQGNSGTWWQEAPVEPGVTYEAAAFFQPEGSPNLWTAAVQQLKLEYYDFSRTNLLATFTRDLSGIPPVPNLSDTNFAGNIWVQQFVSGSAPVGAAWGRVVVFVNGIGPNGTFRIDDVSLRATAPKRSEDFNDWSGTAQLDSTYIRGGWILSTGRTVFAYTNGANVIPLSRSGLAASLTNPGNSTEGSSIRSPRFEDGVGAITFYYRHGYQGAPTNNPEAPVHFKVQRSQLGDFWVTIGEVSNVINTSFLRFDVFNADPNARYMRIVHAGGSTNRLIIDDIHVDAAGTQPRLMTFNSWTNAATVSNHFHLGWRLSNGLASAAFALDGLAGQIAGSTSSNFHLLSPSFNNGYGTISFNYRLGNSSTRTAGLRLEASTTGSAWTVLDTITNITSLSWTSYNRFFLNTAPSQIRIRNLPETNNAPGLTTTVSNNFDNAPSAPDGWTFNQIGAYTGSGNPPPSLRMDATGAIVTTPPLINPTQVVFWTQGQSASPTNYFTVEGVINGEWQTLMIQSNIPGSGTTWTLKLTNAPAQLRFSYFKLAGGNLALDNIRITGSSAGATPQSLVLENVDIGNPLEYRTQNFNAWPAKTNAGTGDTFFQGWTLDGPVTIDGTRAYDGQAATLSLSSGDEEPLDYVVDFEGAGETKTSYAAGTVTLNGIEWTLNEALIGTSPTDWKNGERSLRLRGYAASVMEMTQDRPNGLANIRFNYSRYGTDGQTSWRVEYSTNGGANWTQAGSAITADGTVKTFSQALNVSGNVRVRIRENSGSGASNRRMNVDDIVLSANPGPVTNTPGSITSHFLPDGVGPISFRYRFGGDTAATGPSIMTALIQISSNGTTWSTTSTVSIASTNYTLLEHYISSSNHHYARIIVTNGTGKAVVDEIAIARPQPPANATIIGYYEPDSPFTNDTVTLFANITPLYGARNLSVTSYYRVGTSGAFTAIGMVPNGSVYQATSAIPRQARGSTVYFYINAWYDGPGNQLTEPATYPALAPPHGTNLAFYVIPRNAPGRVWINEVDYFANIPGFFGPDTQEEFIELAGYAGTDITGWRIDLVAGSSTGNYVFASYGITNIHVIQNETNGFGFFVFARTDIPQPPRDVLMDDPDWMAFNVPGGIILYNELGGLEDALSYDGQMFGFDYIGTNEFDNPGFSSSSSVGLTGIGSAPGDFDWTSAEVNKSPGKANSNQVFAVAPVIAVSTNVMTFNYIPFSYDPNVQLLVVSNSGGAGLAYTIAPNVAWLSVSPSVRSNLAAGATQIHTVRVSTVGLSGNRFGTLTIAGTAANSPSVVDVNLIEAGLTDAIVHYDFNEGAGAIAQNLGTAGTNATGRLIGGSWSLEAEGASGSLNDFALINYTGPSTSRLETAIAVTNINRMTNFTVTGWIRPGVNVSNATYRLVGNRASNNGFEIQTASNQSNLVFSTSTGQTVTAATSTNGVFPKGEWTFFAVTVQQSIPNRATVSFYRGNRTAGIFPYSIHTVTNMNGSGVSTGRLHVAGGPTLPYYGMIDDVRIFNGVLDAMSLEATRREGASTLSGAGAPPQIDAQPESQTVPISTPVQFFVDASGVPTPQYLWRKNGAPLTNETAEILFIPTVTTNNAGSYDVIVYNAYGSVTSDVAVLTVAGGLVFIKQPVSQTAYLEETVTFDGTASSFGTITYQWLKAETNINQATNSLLVLTNVQFASEGGYRVIAHDGAVTITSQVATLTVIPFEFNSEAVGSPIGTTTSGTARVVLRWTSITNRVYDILWSTNLMMGTQGFTPMATSIPATPSINVYTDTVHGAIQNGSYRIQVRQP